MPKLLLMRHAKSSWDNAGLADVDRPLNKRGRKDAPRMGRWIASQGLRPARIVSSPACRARETAALVAAALEFHRPIEVRDDLYQTSPAHLADILLGLCAEPGTVLVIGHNPELAELLAHWTGEEIRFPTGTIAYLTVKPGSDDATGPQVRLREVWRPKELPDDT